MPLSQLPNWPEPGRPRYYCLTEHHIAVPCTMLEWGVFLANVENRRVARTEVGPLVVSTVFLGLDHSWSDEGDAVLFETMLFDGDGGEGLDQWRYSTWAEAERGPAEIVALAEIRVAAAKILLEEPHS